jgi:hypothetical protein
VDNNTRLVSYACLPFMLLFAEGSLKEMNRISEHAAGFFIL